MPHPIESIMSCTMENLKQMIDVDTVVGKPVIAGDGSVVIPVSKVSFGFAAGGGVYQLPNKAKGAAVMPSEEEPFAGGAGAGVTVSPVGFLVVSGGQTRMLNVQMDTTWDRIVESLPQLIRDIKQLWQKDPNSPEYL